jgi:alkylation response protein AidB-like acyl-CoA dehydrogenase
MSITFGREQKELQSVVAQFFARSHDLAAVRVATDSPDAYDREVWRRMAGDLGLQAVGAPEEAGGTGESMLDVIAVTEQLGRALDPSPYLASIVLAAQAVLRAGGDPKWLDDLVSGTSTATLAVTEGTDPVGTALATTAEGDGDDVRVTGTKRLVLHGAHVDDIIVLAAHPSGPTLVRVHRDAPGLTVTALDAVDRTRPVADITLDDAPGRVIGAAGEGREVVEQVWARARVALAAEQVGAASAALDLVVAYVKERHQFGRPLGSFQSLKHLLTDVMVEIEASRTAVLHAAGAIDAGDADALILGHMAQAVAGDALMLAAKACTQAHGAIAFTWEHDAHLYLKRATGSFQLLGTPRHHRAAIAALLLDDRARAPHQGVPS